jgi:predicted transcriptional regulator
MSDRRRNDAEAALAEGIAREQNALRRKLAKIRESLGAQAESPQAMEAFCARVQDQIARLPEDQRSLLRTTASLAIADLRESEDALQRYLDLVQQELRRRGSHAAAVKAYGTQPAKAVVRLRRN